jgi:hypothetical protein
MMTKYLIAADADKIQDFLFRSARLRQIVGGSQLLLEFSKTITDKLAQREGSGNGTAEIIINAGGNFRVAFQKPEHAEAFKEELAEVYHRVTGSSLTLVGPEAYDDGEFHAANKKLQEKLRLAKEKGQGPHSVTHTGLIAICASCGRALAATHGRLPHEPGSPTPRYLCQACQDKAQVRQANQSAFLQNLIGRIEDNFKDSNRLTAQDPAAAIARLDPGRYVAYIVADGNGMGKVFDSCQSEEEIKELSEKLEQAMWDSLAEPTNFILAEKDLIQRLQRDDDITLPIVPLIVGGDDLFVLAPAPYALDIARLICQTFQQKMTTPGTPITIAAAVVICKSTYPYKLAHQRGDKALEEAKRFVKGLTADGGPALSAVTFEVITGNALPEPGDEKERAPYRATLRPYWVLPPTEIEEAGNGATAANKRAFDAGLSLDALLEQRYQLRNLPGKRRHELRAVFDELPQTTEMATWTKRIDELLDRIQLGPAGDWRALRKTLTSLGAAPENGRFQWRSIVRPHDNKGNAYSAHGLPDLIEAWNYTFELSKGRDAYETEAQ